MINEQLTRNANRSSSRPYRLGRSYAIGDNVEHIFQNLATIETLNHSTTTLQRSRESEAFQSAPEEVHKDPLNADLHFLCDDSESTSPSQSLLQETGTSCGHCLSAGTTMSQSTSITAPDAALRHFKVGQWVDCLDTVNQWLEATIIEVSSDEQQVKVHYNGWGTRWDETLEVNSARLARFRTRTKNAAQCKTISPTISHWIEGLPSLEGAATNDLSTVVPAVYTTLTELLPQFKRLATSDYGDCATRAEAVLAKTRSCLELAPKLDLMGKALSDLGVALANRPRYRRRYEAVKVRGTFISLLELSVLPYGLKASVERDRTPNGNWNRKERTELLEAEGYDRNLFRLTHGPHDVSSSGRRNRSLELHLHAVLAPDLTGLTPERSAENSQGTSSFLPREPTEEQVPSEPEPVMEPTHSNNSSRAAHPFANNLSNLMTSIQDFRQKLGDQGSAASPQHWTDALGQLEQQVTTELVMMQRQVAELDANH